MAPVMFGLTMLVSSFLLFLVQPMVGRMLLPLLGGAPAVWNTCVVFFQFTLLVGYGYAHWISRWDRGTQVRLHWLLLGSACCVLPIAMVSGALPPSTSDPTFWLITQLALMVGLPFFVVSSNAPILQNWYAYTVRGEKRDPYFLYALSNAGSLAALLAYPLVIEPRAGLSWQTALWTLGFVVLVLGYLACGWFALPRRSEASSGLGAANPSQAGAEARAADPPIPWLRKGHYVVLAAIPSSLMLGVTTFVATEVGSAPMVWVIPLALYLLSFVVAFSRLAPIVRVPLARALPILLLVMPVLLMVDLGQFPLTVAGFHVTTFFVIATVCHGEMARLRPAPSRLTEFYFWMSLGGVLGGSLNALVAPHVFHDVLEYPLVLILAALFRPSCQTPSLDARWSWRDLVWPAALAVLILAAHQLNRLGIDSRVAITLLAYAIPALVCFLVQGGPRIRFALCYALLVFGSASALKSETVLVAERGFFGVNKVVFDRENGFVMLINGTTMHGLRHTDDDHRRQPLSYYHPDGPIGDLFTVTEQAGVRRIGVIGLGTGTVASYFRDGQSVDFYEIDPTVSRFAQDPRYFSFLSDCPARWRIVSGDARVRLRELATTPEIAGERVRPVAWRNDSAVAPYQLLVLDAFSSDSIPSHLLTIEAFQLYRSVLGERGIIGANITNKHMDLRPLIQSLADALGLKAVIREDRVVGTLRQNGGRTSCAWVVLTADENVIEALKRDAGWVDLSTERTVPAWTDDYCNLLDVITW